MRGFIIGKENVGRGAQLFSFTEVVRSREEIVSPTLVLRDIFRSKTMGSNSRKHLKYRSELKRSPGQG